eukprot:3225009-Rhodomonas_salina.3
MYSGSAGPSNAYAYRLLPSAGWYGKQDTALPREVTSLPRLLAHVPHSRAEAFSARVCQHTPSRKWCSLPGSSILPRQPEYQAGYSPTRTGLVIGSRR